MISFQYIDYSEIINLKLKKSASFATLKFKMTFNDRIFFCNFYFIFNSNLNNLKGLLNFLLDLAINKII
jgi:hypothetical protein